MKKVGIKFIIFLGFVAGCTFTPKDKFINPIKQPPNTIKVVVDIQDPNFQDPYPLVAQTTFNFTIDSVSNPIIDNQVLLDGNPLTGVIVSGRKLSFSLNPNTIADGNHTVKIQVKLDTKSGSLADLLGAEYYGVEKDFTVIVDKVLPDPTASLTFAMENGYLTLNWGKLNKTNFYYTIVHNSANLSGDTIILDPTITKFIDYGYVGGTIDYTVYVNNTTGSKQIGNGNYYLKPIALNFSDDSDFSEIISWNNIQINSQNVSIRIEGNNTIKNWTRVVPITQSLISGDTLVMGDKDAIKLTIQRNGFKQYQFDSLVTFTSNGNFSPFQEIVSTTQPKLFTLKGDIKRVGFPVFSKEDSLSGHFYVSIAIQAMVISNDGQTGMVLDNLQKFYKFNPNDFSQFSSYPLNYQGPFPGGGSLNISTGYNANNISSISVNQLAGINYVVNLNPTDIFNYQPRNTAGILDIASGKIVWSDTTNNSSPLISSDGNYFVMDDSAQTHGLIYKNNSGSWNFLGKVPSGTKYFRNNSSTELLVVTSTNISVFDLTKPVDNNKNFSFVRTFSINQNSTVANVGYDELSQNIYIEYLNSTNIGSNKISSIKVYGIQNFNYQGSGDAILNGANGPHIYVNGYHFLGIGYANKIR